MASVCEMRSALEKWSAGEFIVSNKTRGFHTRTLRLYLPQVQDSISVATWRDAQPDMMKLKSNQTRTYDGDGFKKRAACLCFRNDTEEEVSPGERDARITRASAAPQSFRSQAFDVWLRVSSVLALVSLGLVSWVGLATVQQATNATNSKSSVRHGEETREYKGRVASRQARAWINLSVLSLLSTN